MKCRWNHHAREPRPQTNYHLRLSQDRDRYPFPTLSTKHRRISTVPLTHDPRITQTPPSHTASPSHHHALTVGPILPRRGAQAREGRIVAAASWGARARARCRHRGGDGEVTPRDRVGPPARCGMRGNVTMWGCGRVRRWTACTESCCERV